MNERKQKYKRTKLVTTHNTIKKKKNKKKTFVGYNFKFFFPIFKVQ
jgi:hypothetical protein